MHKEALKRAVLMAQKIGYIFISTADVNGTPHTSVIGPLGLDPQDRIKLTGWFCQYTVTNLEINPRMSVVIWEPRLDMGYQLIGEMEEMENVAILDGYAAVERKHPMPQVERTIHLRVDKILGFEKKPHIDVEV